MKVFVAGVVVVGILIAWVVAGGWVELLVLKGAPYCVFGVVGAALVAGRIRVAYLGLVLAGIGLVAFDIGIYVAVRYFPGSSTDPIAMVFVPAWQFVLVLPGLFVLGGLLQRLWPLRRFNESA